ncbi:peptide/nickel transport system substrate-binding protein [Kitasatospora sp. SolWspMP-SS2h]|uniref:ABC transporter substrate-binding protein n=1 Tax=Kitasatospora sp. SolWspMP-SS2h TaxID=1305729 RepID=UPI000DB914C9|nr:ABC transporter substrate-binding protein [Kitasatospora sp. SolWspMP-SS2h]RAJ43537.1 peptide/nickel transport system substrate-binding protein [Kitasatospora sp. SolWspMP-SS2h]
MSRSTAWRAAALVAAIGLGITACSGSGAGSGKAAKDRTLVVESNPVPSFTENYNPFDGNSFLTLANARSLVWEPLFQFNTLTEQDPIPWLAKGYAWSNGNRTLKLTLAPGVKWSDGQAFSSADVKFTFELLKANPAANGGGAPLPGTIETPDADTVVMSFDVPQKANFAGIANQLIVPQHVWSGIKDPATAVVKADQLIGTGPYLLDKFTSQNVTFKVNPQFRETPKVKRISFPAYATNDAATLALSSGEIDLAGNNINNVLNTFVGKNPQHHHLFQQDAPYFPASNTVSLFLNTKSESAPALADPAVRQAISAGMNRKAYTSQCETDYALPATSSSGLLLPNDAKALDPALKDDLKPEADAAKVDALLGAAGWSRTDGKWTKDGRTIKFTIIDPNSFTDYWCAAQAMAKDLNALGFDVDANGAFDFNSWNTAITTGKYDAAIHWGQGGTAYQRLQYVLDPRMGAETGKVAAGDFSKYDPAKSLDAVKAFESAADPAAEQAALHDLQRIMSQDVPAVPVFYGPAWYEYNDTQFTGWPNESDPYMNPSPNSQAYEYIILKLAPRD